MTDKLKQKIQEELKDIPKEMREAIESFDWDKTSTKIGEENFLNESEINDLQVEIALILMGYTSLDNLSDNIESNLLTSKNQAEKIAKELKEKIFSPIYEKITETLKEKTKTEKPTWQQNINFILSGGDYSVFLQRTGTKNNLQKTQTPVSAQINLNHSKLEDLKDNFTI